MNAFAQVASTLASTPATAIATMLGTGLLDITKCDEYGRTLVHYAFTEQAVSLVDALVEYSASTGKGGLWNRQDHDGNTPLHLAVLSSPTQRLPITLISLGADPTIRNKMCQEVEVFWGEDGGGEEEDDARPKSVRNFLLQSSWNRDLSPILVEDSDIVLSSTGSLSSFGPYEAPSAQYAIESRLDSILDKLHNKR